MARCAALENNRNLANFETEISVMRGNFRVNYKTREDKEPFREHVPFCEHVKPIEDLPVAITP